jgi:lipoyl(octanoyl) transferase
VSLDLEPFTRINVCGYRGLKVTRLADHAAHADIDAAARGLTPHLLRHLGVDSAAADRGAGGYSAINTDLQAVNSR